MSYIGTEPAASYTTPTKQTITGTGVATYTLDYDVASEHDIQVFLNNVRQEGGTGKAYTVSDNQITFASNIASTDDLYVIFSHKAVQTLVPPDLSITTGMLKDDAVTSAKLAATIAPTNLETTSTTFKMTDLSTNAFYRKNTWIPILSDSSATTREATIHTGTPSYELGWYERVGDVVTVNWYYQTPSSSFSYTNGSTGTGHLEFAGLPFRIANQTGYYPVASCGYFASWSSWSASYTPMGLGLPNTNRVACYYAVANGVQNLASSHHSSTSASSIWSMTYRTDEA